MPLKKAVLCLSLKHTQHNTQKHTQKEFDQLSKKAKKKRNVWEGSEGISKLQNSFDWNQNSSLTCSKNVNDDVKVAFRLASVRLSKARAMYIYILWDTHVAFICTGLVDSLHCSVERVLTKKKRGQRAGGAHRVHLPASSWRKIKALTGTIRGPYMSGRALYLNWATCKSPPLFYIHWSTTAICYHS